MPRRSGSIRRGSASIISRPWASCPAPIWCWRRSRRAPRKSASRRRSPCCRCITRSASPSNGRRSTCCRAGGSISPPGAATTAANTGRSAPRSTTTRRSSRRGSRSSGACGRAAEPLTHRGRHYQLRRRRDHPAAGAAPDPLLCRLVLEAVDRAGGAGSACNLIVAPFAAAMTFGGLRQVREVYDEACAPPRQQAGAADVQLFPAFRRHAGRRGGRPRPADPLLQGMRDRRLPRRPRDGAAELPLFRRDRRPAQQGAAAGSLARIRCCSAPRRRSSTV